MSYISLLAVANWSHRRRPCGSGTLTIGLGFVSHSSDSCSWVSRSRTLVKYWSSRSRSLRAEVLCSRLALSLTKSSMLRPMLQSCRSGLDLLAVPCTNILRYRAAGLLSGGNLDAAAGERQAAALAMPTWVTRAGKRVSAPIRSAATWSSETLLRNAPLPGCGAAVRNDFSAGCPPSTLGMRHTAEDGHFAR